MIQHFEQPEGVPEKPNGSPKTVAGIVDLNRNHMTSMGTTLDDTNDSITVYPKCSYVNLTASALVKTGAGQVYGIIINSHTTGTLKLWDNTAGSGTVLCETISFGVGERWIPLFGMSFGTGLFATIGGTANLTIAYR
jgi:hypothetical protein